MILSFETVLNFLRENIIFILNKAALPEFTSSEQIYGISFAKVR